MEMDQTLLKEVKDALMITWEDEDTDNTLTDYINSSLSYFIETVSESLDFPLHSPERELVVERVRYRYNNALDDFEKNYASELAALIQRMALKGYLESGEVHG